MLSSATKTKEHRPVPFKQPMTSNPGDWLFGVTIDEYAASVVPLQKENHTQHFGLLYFKIHALKHHRSACHSLLPSQSPPLLYIMKIDILAVLPIFLTLALAQETKQTYIIGLRQSALLGSLSNTIQELLKLVLGVVAPSAAQQWQAGDLIGFIAILDPGQAQILQASPLVSIKDDPIATSGIVKKDY